MEKENVKPDNHSSTGRTGTGTSNKSAAGTAAGTVNPGSPSPNGKQADADGGSADPHGSKAASPGSSKSGTTEPARTSAGSSAGTSAGSSAGSSGTGTGTYARTDTRERDRSAGSGSGASTGKTKTSGNLAVAPIDTQTVLLTTAKMLSDIHAAYKPEPLSQLWSISEQELKPWSECAAKSLELLPGDTAEKYSKYSPVMGLIVSTFMIVYPRMMQERNYVNHLRNSYQANSAAGVQRGNNVSGGNEPNSQGNSNPFAHPGFQSVPNR